MLSLYPSQRLRSSQDYVNIFASTHIDKDAFTVSYIQAARIVFHDKDCLLTTDPKQQEQTPFKSAMIRGRC